ncbi:MAG: response regulator, partial [Ignavibacteria bacterium]|nr:response regulator [Ignavibacteria bacterium]
QDDNTNEYNGSNEFIKSNSKNMQNDTLGKVLLVDDDQDTLFTIDEMVKAFNCETILATNGVECIQILEKTIPDLILLDIMMPEMDGFQTIEKIRSNSEWKNIPVVAVTAKAMMNDKDIIIKHGFDDYISKPVKSSVITSKIQQFLTQIKVKL